MADEKDVQGPVTDNPEIRRKFAQEQLEFLKKQGVKDRLRLSRIFKAAGPGQVQEAWKLATCEDWTQEGDDGHGGPASRDLLDCILWGAGGAQRLNADRMADVLEEAGFYVPVAHSEDCFYRTLWGALEILVPGSYRFSKEERREIEEGLHRRANEDDDEVFEPVP